MTSYLEQLARAAVRRAYELRNQLLWRCLGIPMGRSGTRRY